MATSERDGLDSSLADAMKELEQSAGNRTQVEAEREAMNAEKEELEAKVAALAHAKNAAEDKALALEGQMEALQVCSCAVSTSSSCRTSPTSCGLRIRRHFV